MFLLVAAALVVLSIGVLMYPFLRGRFQSEDSEQVPVMGEVEDILDAIRTLQLEFQLGNVPERQYHEELRAYRMQAAAMLRERMELRGRDADTELEQEFLMAGLDVGEAGPPAAETDSTTDGER